MHEPPLTEILTDSDIETVVKMLGNAAGMGGTVQERRRYIIEELARLVGADIWIWVISRGLDEGKPALLSIVEGGFRDEAEHGLLWRTNIDPEFNQLAMKIIDFSQRRTRIWNADDPDPAFAQGYARHLHAAGIAQTMFSMYPLSPGVLSGIGLHRRLGSSEFTHREQRLAHLVLGQVDWLHRAGTDVPANRADITSIAPRPRETLVHLLIGDSRKQIARKMHITEHTVNDHVKTLYKHFGVNSRAELLALFIGNA